MSSAKTKLTIVAVVIFVFISGLNIYALNTTGAINEAKKDDGFKLTKLASKAYINPCSSILDCGSSSQYCGSITVDDPDGPDYTIVCEGGEANQTVKIR